MAGFIRLKTTHAVKACKERVEHISLCDASDALGNGSGEKYLNKNNELQGLPYTEYVI